MRIVVIVFSGVVALACVAASSTVHAAGARVGGERGEGGPAAASVITAAPATFEVALGDDVVRRLEPQLAHGSLEVARLILRDLRPRAAQALKGVRIFVEKPDADAGTPVADPHYAGNFVLGLEDSQTMLWNIAPALSRLWHSGALTAQGLARRKALRITFVPDPVEPATSLPKDFALTFRSLTIELPRQP
jgi:hypothetical protein